MIILHLIGCRCGIEDPFLNLDQKVPNSILEPRYNTGTRLHAGEMIPRRHCRIRNMIPTAMGGFPVPPVERLDCECGYSRPSARSPIVDDHHTSRRHASACTASGYYTISALIGSQTQLRC
jgi:hypothetical protein